MADVPTASAAASTDTVGRPSGTACQTESSAPPSRGPALQRRGRDGGGGDLRKGGRHTFLVNSLTEEAIRSSQLEGATTSRRVAKELLRSGREPKDRSERMIVNNYRAMQFMRERDGSDADAGRRCSSSIGSSPRERSTTRRGRPAAAPRRGAGRRLRPRRRRAGPLPPLPSNSRTDWSCSARSPTKATRRAVRPPGDSGHPPALLACLRPPLRRRQRADGADPVLLADAVAGLLAGRVPADLADSSGSARPSMRAHSWKPRPTSGDTTYFLIHQLEVIERAIADMHEYLPPEGGRDQGSRSLYVPVTHSYVLLNNIIIRSPDRRMECAKGTHL